MKALVVTILLLTSSFFIKPQNDTQDTSHLKFKGVEIDGSLNQFVSKMKEKGFTHLGTEDGYAILSGDFAGYKDCYIGVYTLDQQDLVSKVAVLFPNCDTWSSLNLNYTNLKELLTQKYGAPSESIEKFQSYSQPRDDNSKMHEIGMNNYTYYTTFKSANGSITLSIENIGFRESRVALKYMDKENSLLILEQALDDL